MKEKGSDVGISFDKIIGACKVGAEARRDADVPVRVAVYVDETASPQIVGWVRDALVPQTTAGLVRVERLAARPLTVKPDTDVALVLSCGSAHLQARAQEIVVAGVPCAVVAESSVEIPFIAQDSRMLGLIAATDREHLLASLAMWILERTDKQTAFAANFAFMRTVAARRAVSGAALANAATGALVFIPGADFPVMTIAQVGMLMQLAAIFGKPLRPERGYEVAGVLAGAVLLRSLARACAPRAGAASFAVKAAVGGVGTYAMGRALMALYERDVDYTPLNDVLAGAVSRVRGLAPDTRAVHRDDAPAPAVATDAA